MGKSIHWRTSGIRQNYNEVRFIQLSYYVTEKVFNFHFCRGNDLTYNNVAKKDAKIYWCFEGPDMIQNIIKQITVYVKYAPLIRRCPGSFSAKESRGEIITCYVEGYPQPGIKWYKNNTEIKGMYNVELLGSVQHY